MNTLFYHGNSVDNSRATFAGTFTDGNLSIGISVCSSGDNFVKKNGRDRAEQRSLGKWNKDNPNEGRLVLEGVQENIKNFVAIATAMDRLPKKQKIRLFHLEKDRSPKKVKE